MSGKINDWENKTDDEVDETVKLALINTHPKESEYDKMFLSSLKTSKFNYCNNALYAWPIILENKINICFGSELATAKAFIATNLVEVVDKNPLRAAMIVFLMMQE